MMEESMNIYYRGGLLYLQPLILPTDLAGNWLNLGGIPSNSIVVAKPTVIDLAAKIPEALSHSVNVPFADKNEIQIAGKANIENLLKMVRVRSYKQFQKGTSQLLLIKMDHKIEGVQGYPDEKNRGWTGRGNYEDRLFFDAPFNYEEIAEAVLKHLLNPANRYPEE